jgi:hypothetical protein
VYPAKDSPYYRLRMWVCVGFMLFNGVLAFGLRCLLMWENKKLDRKYGVARRVDGEGKVGVGDENDGARFRYVL